MLPTNTSNYDSSNFNPEQIMKTLSDMQTELEAVKQLAGEQALKIRRQDEMIQKLARRIVEAEDTVGNFESREEALGERCTQISTKADEYHEELVNATGVQADALFAESMVNSDFQQYVLTYHEKMAARMAAVEERVGIISEERTKEESEFTSPTFNPNPVSLGNLSRPLSNSKFLALLSPAARVRNPFVPPVDHTYEAEEMKPEDYKGRANASPLSPSVCRIIFNETAEKLASEGKAVNEVPKEDETF